MRSCWQCLGSVGSGTFWLLKKKLKIVKKLFTPKLQIFHFIKRKIVKIFPVSKWSTELYHKNKQKEEEKLFQIVFG